MNITFVLPAGAGLGGVTTWSIEMARQLAAVGQAASLLEHVNPTTDHRVQVPPGAHLVRHYGRQPSRLHASDIRKYVSTYRRVLPSLVVPNYFWGTYAACAAIARRRASQLRVLGFAHADEAHYYDLLEYYEPMVHFFVAVSQEVAETLENRMPHRCRDIFVHPYGVEVADSLGRIYSLPHEPIRLVYAGRLVERQKKVSHLITLAEILGRRRVDFCLRIIGEGEEKDNLLQRVQQLDPALRARIRFEGRIPHHQMPQAWRSADVCVLVSEYEGTSIAMLEAMAEGCVPVVTRVSGASTVVTPGENGYLVDVDDIAGMARIIGGLAAERDELARLGFSAHRTIKDRFPLPAYVGWFLRVADEVWEQPPRAWPATRVLLPFGKMHPLVWKVVSSPIRIIGGLCGSILRGKEV